MSKLKETFTKHELSSLPNFLKYVKEELSEVIVFNESLFTHMYNVSASLLEKTTKEQPPSSLSLQGFEVAYGLVILSQPQEDGSVPKEIAGQKLPSWNKIVFTLLDSDNDGKITKTDIVALLSTLVGCSFKPEDDDDDDDDDEFKYVNSMFPEGSEGLLDLDAFEKVSSNIPITLYSVLVDVVKYIGEIVLTPSKKRAAELSKKETAPSGLFSLMFKKKDEKTEPKDDEEHPIPIEDEEVSITPSDDTKAAEENSSAITEDFTDSDEEEEAARHTIKVFIKPKEEVTVSNISLSNRSFIKPPQAMSSRRRLAVSDRVKLTESSHISLEKQQNENDSETLQKNEQPDEKKEGDADTEAEIKSETKTETKTEIKSETKTEIKNVDFESDLFGSSTVETPFDPSDLFKEAIASETVENPLNPFREEQQPQEPQKDVIQDDFFSATESVLSESNSTSFFSSGVQIDSSITVVSSQQQQPQPPQSLETSISTEDFFSASNNEGECEFEIVEEEKKDEDKNNNDSKNNSEDDKKVPVVKYVLPNRKAKREFSDCMKDMELGEYGSALDHAQNALRALSDNTHPRYSRMVTSYLIAARILESIAASSKSADHRKMSLLGTWLASIPLHKAHREACLLIASVYSDSAARAASAVIPDWSHYASQCYPNGGIYTHIHCRSCKSLCDASLPRCFVCGTPVLYCCLSMNPIQEAQYKRCRFCSGTFISMLLLTNNCPLCGRDALYLTSQ